MTQHGDTALCHLGQKTLKALTNSQSWCGLYASRLVKNRQAAQLFRKRQKEYIADLENKVAEVTNKNIALMAKVDVLASENKLVKDQLAFLRTFVVGALQSAFTPGKFQEMQDQLGDIGLNKPQQQQQQQQKDEKDASSKLLNLQFQQFQEQQQQQLKQALPKMEEN